MNIEKVKIYLTGFSLALLFIFISYQLGYFFGMSSGYHKGFSASSGISNEFLNEILQDLEKLKNNNSDSRENSIQFINKTIIKINDKKSAQQGDAPETGSSE